MNPRETLTYCRFSEGDVYLVPSGATWSCYFCKLHPDRRVFTLGSPIRAYLHLLQHKKAGHPFPEQAFALLGAEVPSWLEENPAIEEIHTALCLYFQEEAPFPGLLESLSQVPPELWEKKYLAPLEAFEPRDHYDPQVPLSSWRKIHAFTQKLFPPRLFPSRNQVLVLLHYWKRALRSMIDEGLLPARFSSPLPNRPNPSLPGSIPQPKDYLEKLEETIRALTSSRP